MTRPSMTLTATVLDSEDAQELAAFYQRLLGWEFRANEPGCASLRNPTGGGLSFQSNPTYVRPTWPARPGIDTDPDIRTGPGDRRDPGDQQMQLHLDFEVHDLPAAGEHAVRAGATLADFQPQDDVRVYFDPAGHPFCLWIAT